MVDTKKEQERDELHRAIWAIADELRGAEDSSLQDDGQVYGRLVGRRKHIDHSEHIDNQR